MNKEGKKKRKLRISGLIFIILVIYLIVMVVYYLFTMPIKSIVVLNNDNLKESDIIKRAQIDVGTSIFKMLTANTKKKIRNMPLVKDVKLKVNLSGDVTLDILENKILFIDSSSDEIVLEDSTKIPNNNEYKAVPLLVNYVPSEVYNKFITSFSKIDINIIHMISEIVYSPNEYNNTIIDEERFLLKMNDGNVIYINNVNIEKLNRYQTIYASISEKGKGVLYLDSSSENYIFNVFTEGE